MQDIQKKNKMNINLSRISFLLSIVTGVVLVAFLLFLGGLIIQRCHGKKLLFRKRLGESGVVGV